MNKIKPKTINRSHTNRQLPSIALQTPRHAKGRQLSSYLSQVNHELSNNVEYEGIDHKGLSKEQQKLKQILKKMNEDTVKIISHYTPRAKKTEHRRTTTSVLAVKEKQTENNNHILAQCQAEIQKLKERSAQLHHHTKEQYDEVLRNTAEEISIAQEAIRQIRLHNDKRGKMILSEQRIIEEGEIRKLETDYSLVQLRATRLRKDNERVNQQIKFYQEKLKEISSKCVQADKFWKDIEKKNKEQEDIKNSERDYIEKKVHLEKIRRKKQFLIQNSQYRYYRILKQIQQSNNNANEAEDKIQKSFISIEASKMAIIKLEQKLKKIKQKKRQRDRNINQFLTRTRMGDSQQTARKIQSGFNGDGEILSQIQIKQEAEGDHSAILFEKEIKGEVENSKEKPKQSQMLQPQNQVRDEKKQVQESSDILAEEVVEKQEAQGNGNGK